MMTFPLLTAAISDRRAEQFTAVLAQITTAQADGRVANPVFQTIKETVNRVFSDAFDSAIKRTYWYSRDYAATEAETNLIRALGYSPEIHTVGAFQKRITKAALTTEMTTKMGAMISEMAALAEAVLAVKATVFKREPKAVTEARAKAAYVAPRAEVEATKAIRTLLLSFVEANRADLVQRITDQGNRIVSAFIARPVKTDRQGVAFKESIGRHFRRDDQSIALVSRCVTINGLETLRVPNAAEIIRVNAETTATAILESFVEKNLKKLVAIIVAKGDFATAEVVGKIYNGGLDGMMKVSFKDGSSFVVNNQIVYVVNSYGTAFNRFPTTFHNVCFGNGAKMGQPSEKRMNEVFAKAA